MFRDSARAFGTDALALRCAQQAVAKGMDAQLSSIQAQFLCMPYMHSEDRAVHEQAMQLFSKPGFESMLDYEKRHKAIVDQFGRYPHRNAALGRESTAEEMEFMKTNKGF